MKNCRIASPAPICQHALRRNAGVFATRRNALNAFRAFGWVFQQAASAPIWLSKGRPLKKASPGKAKRRHTKIVTRFPREFRAPIAAAASYGELVADRDSVGFSAAKLASLLAEPRDAPGFLGSAKSLSRPLSSKGIPDRIESRSARQVPRLRLKARSSDAGASESYACQGSKASPGRPRVLDGWPASDVRRRITWRGVFQAPSRSEAD